jgi:hypothetical protein
LKNYESGPSVSKCYYAAPAPKASGAAYKRIEAMILFVITGALLIILSLILGWLIVAKRYLGLLPLNRIFRNDGMLAKCHMEYVIMALLLFAIYLFNIELPLYIVLLTCIGAVSNPSLFLIIAIKPDIDKSLTSPFSLISTCSFLITTIGFGCSSAFIVYSLAGR